MQATNLARVADELYTLAPSAFTAARDERAAEARASGDAGLAGEIRKLRGPTVSAWLVNLLVREEPGQMGELLELGASLREAQQALAGDRLRDLSAQRGRVVTTLIQEAKRLAAPAGQPVSAQVEREVQDTLEASLADADIAEAVRSGRLTRALSYAGLGGGIGVDDAVAVWTAPGKQAAPAGQRTRPVTQQRETPAARHGRREAGTTARDRKEAEAARRAQREAEAAERARQEAEAAERNLREAAEDAREAQAALDAAEREVASARDSHEARQRRADELERQLQQIQAESAQDLRVLRQAQRSRDVAARALDGARRRLARAEAKAKAGQRR